VIREALVKKLEDFEATTVGGSVAVFIEGSEHQPKLAVADAEGEELWAF
jgi:hypothetical protein